MVVAVMVVGYVYMCICVYMCVCVYVYMYIPVLVVASDHKELILRYELQRK